MTNPAQRGAALAKLHIAKKEMGMDDESYRSLLVRHGAPAADPSARNLRIQQIDAALQEMISKGWRPKRRAAPGAAKGKKLSPATRHKPAGQKTKADALRAVWVGMAKAGYLRDGSDDALLVWVRKQSACAGKPIDAIEWLDQDDELVTILLHRLKSWQRRLAKMAQA